MKINVLIFPCEGNSNELHDALSYCYNLNVFGASSTAKHGQYIYRNYNCSLPYITDATFIEKFNAYLDDNKIDIIIPNHDTVALFLAENAACIKAKVIQNDIYTNKICRSKILTHNLFKDCDFIPIRYDKLENVKYPAFVKPDIGAGGQGAFLARSSNALVNLPLNEYLITEYLPGKELTIDCFTDKNNKLRYISPRSRQRIMSGISVAGSTESLTNRVRDIANTINDKLNFDGLWYFQLKEDYDGVLKLMEISVRCAGTMCLTRAKGINLPLLSVYNAMGHDVTIYDNANMVEMDRSLIGRYKLHIDYNYVYIDFDDTITLRNNINPLAMFFLYQCRNNGKKVYLLTRHANNIHDTLLKYAISENLFEQIIYVNDDLPKADYIQNSQSIFIDNMFQERINVKTQCKIPVFDADAFEFLLDWRI